jgi:myo-inositol-1(or 4)-monophosphatase
MTSEIKTFMVDLTRKAGAVLLDSFQHDQTLTALRSTAKEAATTQDRIVDQLIVEEISKTYPDHRLLTEESGYHQGDSDWLWIVDSLDGTGNFANGNPFFSVCLALMYQDTLLLGTIYAPAINEFYLAERGGGAYLNQTKITVSTIQVLKKSYLYYCEGGDINRKRTGTLLSTLYPEVTDIRKLGSAGLETAWVAAGRGEAYVTTKIDPWDVAPGVLLIEEAGGKVTDFTAEKWKPERGDFIFSNEKVHADILKLVSNQ